MSVNLYRIPTGPPEIYDPHSKKQFPRLFWTLSTHFHRKATLNSGRGRGSGPRPTSVGLSNRVPRFIVNPALT